MIIVCFRNPNASDRPKFDALEAELLKLKSECASDTSLNANLGTNPSTTDECDSLYSDLQNIYQDVIDT